MTVQQNNIPYGPGAYRADAIPTLPRGQEDRAGIMHTPLQWGHYTGLDSASGLSG